MKRKMYEMPSTQVVRLQRTAMLMSSPGGLDDPNDYESGGDPFASPSREFDGDLEDLGDDELSDM